MRAFCERFGCARVGVAMAWNACCRVESGDEEGDAAGHPKVIQNSNIIVLMSKLIGYELNI
ncbi:hypothetical protein PUN4_20089 [Paraburkholderia unamae]|nr:hypothetical protein PUN4_20089 [Paraburkholderia unamae]